MAKWVGLINAQDLKKFSVRFLCGVHGYLSTNHLLPLLDHVTIQLRENCIQDDTPYKLHSCTPNELTWNVEQHGEYEKVVKIEAHIGRIWERIVPLFPCPDHWQGGKVQ